MDPELWGCAIFGPKRVHLPQTNTYLAIFDHFWSFLPTDIFSKKSSSVTHNYIWAPNTMLSFRKNYWANSERKYAQTEGRMDRPYFIGPFWPRTGVQQKENVFFLVALFRVGLLYFLSVAYLTVANLARLGISVHLVRLLS